MSPAVRWTIAIVSLLGGNVLAVVLLIVASTGHERQVIPAYYEKAVHYDDRIDQDTANAALGWRTAVRLGPAGIEVDVRDRGGATLTGAKVHVTGYQRANASELIDADLVANAAGTYLAPRRDAHPGVYDLTITVERDGARYTSRAALDSAAPLDTPAKVAGARP
jgi:nitrogen fixation protein FixH